MGMLRFQWRIISPDSLAEYSKCGIFSSFMSEKTLYSLNTEKNTSISLHVYFVLSDALQKYTFLQISVQI